MCVQALQSIGWITFLFRRKIKILQYRHHIATHSLFCFALRIAQLLNFTHKKNTYIHILLLYHLYFCASRSTNKPFIYLSIRSAEISRSVAGRRPPSAAPRCRRSPPPTRGTARTGNYLRKRTSTSLTSISRRTSYKRPEAGIEHSVLGLLIREITGTSVYGLFAETS